MIFNQIPLFGFLKSEWSVMEYDGIHSIPFHHLLLFFIPPNLGGVQWNET